MEELKFHQENEDGGIIILDDLKKKKSMIPEYKQCSNDQDILTYLYS